MAPPSTPSSTPPPHRAACVQTHGALGEPRAPPFTREGHAPPEGVSEEKRSATLWPFGRAKPPTCGPARVLRTMRRVAPCVCTSAWPPSGRATSARRVTRDQEGLDPTESDVGARLVPTEFPVRRGRVLTSSAEDGACPQRHPVPLPDTGAKSAPEGREGTGLHVLGRLGSDLVGG